MSKANPELPADTSHRLNPISYVILGLLQLRGPSTPYDLKRAVERSIQYFWPFPHAQLYGETDRLAGLGLVTKEQQEGGRRRKVFTLAPAGRAALETWFLKSPEHLFELRDMAILQLFFSDFMGTDRLADLAHEQVTHHHQRIAIFEEIAARGAGHSGERRMLPLDLGIRLAQTCADFWAEVAGRTDA